MVELVDVMPTFADLLGLEHLLKPGALDGTSMLPILDGQEDTGWLKNASFSQYPRCTNTSKSREPPFLGTRDPCNQVPANEFTYMGPS